MDNKKFQHGLEVLAKISKIVDPDDAKSWCRICNKYKENGTVKYVLDNGGGDGFHTWFTERGIFVKGFDHESMLNQFGADEWDEAFFERVYAGAPNEFMELLSDEERESTTFAMWYLEDTGEWYENPDEADDGGKAFLLGYVPENADDLWDWAKDYYGNELDEKTVRGLFEE